MKKEITLDISCRYALARPFVDETVPWRRDEGWTMEEDSFELFSNG